MFKDIVKPAMILAIICILFTGALAYINAITEPIIEENTILAERESLKNVFSGAENFLEPKSAEQLKTEGYIVSEKIGKVYEAQKDGESVGYVVEVTPRGYGGAIKMFVGIDKTQSITGVVLTSHNETPGLGAKGAEPKFKDQFVGAIPEKEYFVVKKAPNADNEIQAVSGATITSKGVTSGVTDAVALVRSMSGGK